MKKYLKYTHVSKEGITLWMIWKDEQYNRFVIRCTQQLTVDIEILPIIIYYKRMRLKPLSERPRELSFLSCTYRRINFISLINALVCLRENEEDYFLQSPVGDWCVEPPLARFPSARFWYLHNLLPWMPLLSWMHSGRGFLKISQPLISRAAEYFNQ